MFQDDSRLASRFVAIASRLMIEAGLHQKYILLQRFPQGIERTRVLIVLTTSMILDRQLNFNAGLPYTLKDTDIELPDVVRPLHSHTVDQDSRWCVCRTNSLPTSKP